MSTQELKRLKVVELIEAKQVTVAEGAAVLGISERQMWRVARRCRQAGAAGLVHGNRNQPSPRRLSAAIRNEIVALAGGKYRDDNDQHLTEVLQEELGLTVSRASVRRIDGCGVERQRQPILAGSIRQDHHRHDPTGAAAYRAARPSCKVGRVCVFCDCIDAYWPQC